MREAGPEFITIDNQTALVTVVAHLARDHLDRHTDFHRLLAQIGELRSNHWAFIQFDQRHSIRRIGIVTGGRFINRRKGIDFAFPAKGKTFLGLSAAGLTYVTRWEDPGVTMRAHFPDQRITLLFQSPVAWNFHKVSPIFLYYDFNC